jgi:hypothetical protein
MIFPLKTPAGFQPSGQHTARSPAFQQENIGKSRFGAQ